MKVTIRGISGKFHTLDLSHATDVALLRQRLEDLENIPAHQIKLVYAGKTLRDGYELGSYYLDEYNLSGEAVIYMQVGPCFSLPSFCPFFLCPKFPYNKFISISE